MSDHRGWIVFPAGGDLESLRDLRQFARNGLDAFGRDGLLAVANPKNPAFQFSNHCLWLHDGIPVVWRDDCPHDLVLGLRSALERDGLL